MLPIARLRRLLQALAVVAGLSLVGGAQQPLPEKLDKKAEQWVKRTLEQMTLDEKVGQLIISRFDSTYTSTDSSRYEAMDTLVRKYHVGGFTVFGSSEPAPAVLLNPSYGTVTLGQPFDAASILNRLQRTAAVPLLAAADFETGLGFRLVGATMFPRAMAFGAARDERLAYEAGRITAVEGRAIGVHVNLGPVADVNNNPRNPVINTRSFGEDPAFVGAMAAAVIRGLAAGGMLATLKHFPGHGDTSMDTHLGLATITHPRERLDSIELPPFRAGIAAGAAGVMTGHIELPALDPAPGVPATLSRATVTGLLRNELGFSGLIFPDSLRMNAIMKMMSPGEAAVRAVKAGNDIVLDSVDDVAAFEAVKAAVASGEIPVGQIDASVDRVLRAKARLNLHQSRTVDLEAIPARVGARAHEAVAQQVSERSITLIKDDLQQVPLKSPRDAAVLYLSVLDYPSGWRIAAPSRTFIPELKKRWPNVTAIELSERSTMSEIDLVRTMAARYDVVIASVFVRTSSASGRMDLAPSLALLLQTIAKTTSVTKAPFIAALFGNPYVATMLPDLPAMLLTYDTGDRAEASALRAIAGEIGIAGRLPITLPGLFPAGRGLERPVAVPTAAR